jgi:hypothetical protein
MRVLCVFLASLDGGVPIEHNAIIEALDYPLSKDELGELYEGLANLMQPGEGDKPKIVILNLLPLREENQ